MNQFRYLADCILMPDWCMTAVKKGYCVMSIKKLEIVKCKMNMNVPQISRKGK